MLTLTFMLVPSAASGGGRMFSGRPFVYVYESMHTFVNVSYKRLGEIFTKFKGFSLGPRKTK